MLVNFFCEIVLKKEESNNINIMNNETVVNRVGGGVNDGGVGGNTLDILHQFQRLSQAITVLQLEKPSDWSSFANEVGDSVENNLTKDEIKRVMGLRRDFSEEAIASVCERSGQIL